MRAGVPLLLPRRRGVLKGDGQREVIGGEDLGGEPGLGPQAHLALVHELQGGGGDQRVGRVENVVQRPLEVSRKVGKPVFL